MVGPRRALVSVWLLSLALLAACGGGGPAGPTPTPAAPVDGALTVRAAEWSFLPSRIFLHQGEQVRIELKNEGEILHDLRIDDLTADVSESTSSGPLSAGAGDVFVAADTGRSGTLVFTPRETGTFTYYCDIPRHRQLGMKGTVTVE